MDLWALGSTAFLDLNRGLWSSINVNIVRFIDHNGQQMTLNRTDSPESSSSSSRAKNRFIDNFFCIHLGSSFVHSLVRSFSTSHHYFTFDSIVLICLKYSVMWVCVHTIMEILCGRKVICAHDTHPHTHTHVMLYLNVNTNNHITIIIGDMHVNGMRIEE